METNSWDAIERIAVELGIGPEALRKWRKRGVPRAWRLDLLRTDRRHEIVEQDFDNPPGPRRSREGRMTDTPGDDDPAPAKAKSRGMAAA